MQADTHTHKQTWPSKNSLSQHIFSPWSRSEADTVNTLVPRGWFSEIWPSYWFSSNQGTSSLTSITWTHSSWLEECWGIPWSSAIIVRLKMSCSSRSRGLKIDRAPVERWIKGEMWDEISYISKHVCVCVCVGRGSLYYSQLTSAVWKHAQDQMPPSITACSQTMKRLSVKSCRVRPKSVLIFTTHTHRALPTWALPPPLLLQPTVWPRFMRFSVGDCHNHRERGSKHTL